MTTIHLPRSGGGGYILHRYKHSLHMVVVYIEKAYDRVPRQEVWRCMREKGIQEKHVRLVQDTHEGARTQVTSSAGTTMKIHLEMGLHQGSSLSPYLFVLSDFSYAEMHLFQFDLIIGRIAHQNESRFASDQFQFHVVAVHENSLLHEQVVVSRKVRLIGCHSHSFCVCRVRCFYRGPRASPSNRLSWSSRVPLQSSIVVLARPPSIVYRGPRASPFNRLSRMRISTGFFSPNRQRRAAFPNRLYTDRCWWTGLLAYRSDRDPLDSTCYGED